MKIYIDNCAIEINKIIANEPAERRREAGEAAAL